MRDSTLLLLDDSLEAYNNLKKLLGNKYVVHLVKSLSANINEIICSLSPSIIIIDLMIENDSYQSLFLCKDIHKEFKSLPIIIWTKHSVDNLKDNIFVKNDNNIFLCQKYVDDKKLIDIIEDLYNTLPHNKIMNTD